MDFSLLAAEKSYSIYLLFLYMFVLCLFRRSLRSFQTVSHLLNREASRSVQADWERRVQHSLILSSDEAKIHLRSAFNWNNVAIVNLP